MKPKLKFYALPLIVSVLCLTYLLLFFLYDWSVSGYETFDTALRNVISRNPRWITWGACASGPSLIAGLMLGIGLLFSSSTKEFFEHFENIFFDLQKEYRRRGLPQVRGISIFFALIIVTMLAVNPEDWYLGLRDGLEVIAICAWIVFLMSTLTILPTAFVNVFHRELHNLLLKIRSKDSDSNKFG